MKSQTETLFAAQLEQAGIMFKREWKFHPERKWRFDFFISTISHRGQSYAVEIEGGTWMTKSRHKTAKGMHADMEKYNVAAIMGYRVLRFSTDMINNGSALEIVKRAIA